MRALVAVRPRHRLLWNDFDFVADCSCETGQSGPGTLSVSGWCVLPLLVDKLSGYLAQLFLVLSTV